MPERRYSDDEVAEIFARASEAERTEQSSGTLMRSSDGMTLSQVQAIAREAGLDPALVERAATTMDQPPAASRSTRFFGLPLGVSHTVALPRRLSDEEWERLVVDLRETFDARGTMRTDGAFRQWSNGNLQVLVEPDGAGQRVRFRTVKGDARAWMFAGLGLMSTALVTGVAGAVTGSMSTSDPIERLLTLGMLGAGLFGLGAIRLPGWARLRRAQMEAIGSRLTQRLSD